MISEMSDVPRLVRDLADAAKSPTGKVKVETPTVDEVKEFILWLRDEIQRRKKRHKLS
jgi:hypothetical protein